MVQLHPGPPLVVWHFYFMKNISEKAIIFTLFLVQFIDVLDFMVVMPLGQDLAFALHIPEPKLGYTVSAYAFAAAITGILSSTFIDRFDRKKVLLLTLVGLALANLFSGFAWNFESLLISRFIAGSFGGPATSICFAIVADLFEVKTRGKVMGKVMGGFSLAAILGVPIGLKASYYFGWYMSFFFVALLSALTIILVIIFLPSIHKQSTEKVTYLSLFNSSTNVLTFTAVFLGTMAAFMMIPYISSFAQLNLGFPRRKLDYIFLIGGTYSFFAMRLAGRLTDIKSTSFTTSISNIFIFISLLFGFIFTGIFPVLAVFPLFMLGMSIRNVAGYTLFSKIPNANERAGFMSIISCISHIASSSGALLASAILVNQTGHPLQNIEINVIISLGLFLVIPVIYKVIENRLKS